MKVINEELLQQWQEVYQLFGQDSRSEDAHYESLCVGWCLAKGLSVDDAYEFYQSLIPLNMF